MTSEDGIEEAGVLQFGDERVLFSHDGMLRSSAWVEWTRADRTAANVGPRAQVELEDGTLHMLEDGVRSEEIRCVPRASTPVEGLSDCGTASERQEIVAYVRSGTPGSFSRWNARAVFLPCLRPSTASHRLLNRLQQGRVEDPRPPILEHLAEVSTPWSGPEDADARTIWEALDAERFHGIPAHALHPDLPADDALLYAAVAPDLPRGDTDERLLRAAATYLLTGDATELDALAATRGSEEAE